jgi:hypothetical protein
MSYIELANDSMNVKLTAQEKKLVADVSSEITKWLIESDEVIEEGDRKYNVACNGFFNGNGALFDATRPCPRAKLVKLLVEVTGLPADRTADHVCWLAGLAPFDDPEHPDHRKRPPLSMNSRGEFISYKMRKQRGRSG